VVHCAAGKDRTGMVVALALSIAGVDRPVIAADYELSQSRIEAILDQLSRNELYGTAVTRPEQIPPASAEVLLAVFEAIDAEHGGVPAWLGAQGWTGADTERLRAKLVD
ncbi:MAG: tyrosine-protein phosphatase, partial [Jatrophihabitans sp.]